MSDRFRVWGGCFVLVFFFHPDLIENPPYFVCLSSSILEFCYFSLVLAGLVSCLNPPSFLGVFLVSLLFILLFWLCVVYVVVNVKNRISPWKRQFLDGFGSHKTQSLKKVFGALSLCLSFPVLVADQMLVFYLFSLVSCQLRAHSNFFCFFLSVVCCFVVLVYG